MYGRKKGIEARAKESSFADDGAGQCYWNRAFLWFGFNYLPDGAVGDAGLPDWRRGDLFYHAHAGGDGCG